jgi:hypothetical protein
MIKKYDICHIFEIWKTKKAIRRMAFISVYVQLKLKFKNYGAPLGFKFVVRAKFSL